MRKKMFKGGILVLFLVSVLGFIWNSYFSATKVAFINYQVINLGQLSKANTNSFIKIYELSIDQLKQLNNYDMVFINAMGLRITETEHDIIQKAAANGLPIFTSSATNPENNIHSLDSLQQTTLRNYLSNGGRTNYTNLLNYVRTCIDKKKYAIYEVNEPIERTASLLYHVNIKDSNLEELSFNSIAEYHTFLKKNDLWKENASHIIVTGQMGEPTDLIAKLEETGNIVYPIRDIHTLIKLNQIDSIQPAAIINMAHGRLGDDIVNYLTHQNIPLFSPLNVNKLVDEWEEDKMGMNGGFLSQSVVTPEIDGAIRPYALFAHYKDKDGLHHAFAVPERLKAFTETVNNYIRLKQKSNHDKRVAIYYYKGAGQNALTAGGMEVIPSLYNFLLELMEQGYNVGTLPTSSKHLEQMIQAQGAVLGNYAEGALEEFMNKAMPELITKEEYEGWVKQTLRPEKYAEVVAAYGEFPGQYMQTEDGKLAVARLQFGNVTLLPQTAAGVGNNAFKVVHGTDAAPPHPYIASYLWTQFGFKADVMIHFGTHGSLEFTPRKQVALSSNDWPDRLVGTLPHFYIYSIANVGEGVIAKRRAYAGLQSYLTPPFLESNLRGTYRELSEAIKIYNQHLATKYELLSTNKSSNNVDDKIKISSLLIKKKVLELGIHRELELDSLFNSPYSEEEILKVENFAEELATEKISGQLYTIGTPYEEARINSSVYAMSTDPIAYSLLALDKLRGRIDEESSKRKTIVTKRYLDPSRLLVGKLLTNSVVVSDALICAVCDITQEELIQARTIVKMQKSPKGMMSMMMGASSTPSIPPKANSTAMERMKEVAKGMTQEQIMELAKSMGANPDAMKEMKRAMSNEHSAASSTVVTKKEYNKGEIQFAFAIIEIERTMQNVNHYKNALKESPKMELNSLLKAMNGGYTPPSPGGDPIANPNTLPTGRNLYSINAEATPSESAWNKGIQLANNTIEMYKRRHNDSIPRKVSYTLWSGEFIETEGATIAQILYMLGVEPIRDTFGRVSDLRLISSKELGRPRIDVVVQTSGQLRDIAASRLFLINRAVEMAALAKEDEFENNVAEGVVEAERALIEKGLTPKDAREISTFRVFGGSNGSYGTGIQGMVMSGDRWENETEIADVYLNNMGAYYGNEKNWEAFRQFAFQAALTRTDAVVQPRQSNTWGALSLDHVYEFMGGLNLAVRQVTGKDPDAYFSDYRNRNNVRMQELKESIGVESRTTIFNPTYIKERMKGGAGSAHSFAEIVQNTYGWNVMKPNVIDKEMWNEIYNVYVKDKFNLGIQDYFEEHNPAALEEITAVMLETARKGMWKASEAQLADIANVHTELIEKYKPSCSGFVCDNAKLRQFITSKVSEQSAKQYQQAIQKIRATTTNVDNQGVVMKKEEVSGNSNEEQTNMLSNLVVGVSLLLLIILILLLVRSRKKMEE